mgnify:CR=1 FL=1
MELRFMLKRFLLALCGLLLATSSFAQQDAINLSQAVVWNSPTDVASWPITTRIERLDMRPQGAANDGLEFFFSRRYNWPNYTPPGWSGPLNYTVWAGVRINGVWHVSGIIQFWSARVATGAPILANNNFAINWVYDGRWGAMAHYQPVAGEAMVFFITAGDARGNSGVTSVRERSNVVMVNLPANDSGSFTFPVTFTRADLVVDNGSQGVLTLTDAANLVPIHPLNPEAVATGDFDGNGIDEVAFDFGPSYGLWVRWNGSSWGQLHTVSPSILATGDLDGNGTDELLVGFPGAGLFAFYYGGSWWKIHDTVPTRVAVANIDGGGGGDIVADFPGGGVWILFNRIAWFQLHTQNASDLVAANFDGAGFDDLRARTDDTGRARRVATDATRNVREMLTCHLTRPNGELTKGTIYEVPPRADSRRIRTGTGHHPCRILPRK